MKVATTKTTTKSRHKLYVLHEPLCIMAWSDDEEAKLEANYFDCTYNELSEILDKPRGTVQGKAARMGLPEKTQANELEYHYGVPIEWLLDTLHNTLEKPITQMATELDVSHGWIQNQMADRDIHKRNPSEAKELVWKDVDEDERKERMAETRKSLPEYDDEEHPLVRWRKENPNEAAEVYAKARREGPLAREENGMKGVTGQDSPTWLGGRSAYDAVKKQLHGPSWAAEREQYLADECRVCDAKEDLTLHHIVPLMAGGTNGEYNYMTLCRSCHKSIEWHICRHFDTVLAE